MFVAFKKRESERMSYLGRINLHRLFAPPQLTTRHSKREGDLDLVITDCKMYHRNKYK